MKVTRHRKKGVGESRPRHQEIRRNHRRGRCVPGDSSRGNLRPARRFRLGQIDATAHARRLRAPDRRADSARRCRHHRHAAVRTADQHDVPVLCAVPAHDGGAEHRLRPQAGPFARQRNRCPCRRNAAAGAHDPIRKNANPISCPAASVSVWHWRVRWPSGRSCCCSTNRWGALDKKSCARRCNWSWWKSSSASA